MSRRASLSMYDLPALRPATDAWWGGLAAALRAAGVEDVPVSLVRSADPAADWADPNLLLSQTCGYPLTHAFAGRLAPVATPCYAAPGCDGPYYRSLIVAAADSPIRRLADLSGTVCAVNGWDSQSGWNALAAAVAPLAENGRIFAGAMLTGSHAASLAAVAKRRSDVAAIDAVTFALLARYDPTATSDVRVIGETAPAPGLPYVTRATAPPDEMSRLRSAVAAAAADPALAGIRAALLIDGVAVLEAADYAPIRAMAARAATIRRPPIVQGRTPDVVSD